MPVKVTLPPDPVLAIVMAPGVPETAFEITPEKVEATPF